MNLLFQSNDIFHNIITVFTRSCLPNAKKHYHIKTIKQTELDIHGIATISKIYNTHISPEIIEQSLNAVMELICVLVADGYIIKTPLFTIEVKFRGEYTGKEQKLHKGTYPYVRIKTTKMFRDYVKNRTNVIIDGIENTNGFIAKVIDESSGIENKTVTPGQLFEIYGIGLKIEYTEDNKDTAGVYFESAKDGTLIKATIIAVNKPRLLKVIVPKGLRSDTAYRIVIKTQSTKAHGSTLLKDIRIMRSDFTVTLPTG
jgi:hypothetical protein